MNMRRSNGAARVLVHVSGKASAEILTRGIRAISATPIEIDVALETGVVRRQLCDCTYDAFLVMGNADAAAGPEPLPSAEMMVADLVDAVPDGLPVILVGGAPGKVRSNGVFRVPLPLSYSLLERTLLRAFARRGVSIEPAERRRHDQAG